MTKSNPLNLKIGDKVRITGTTNVEYDKEDNRILKHLPHQMLVLVCGIKKKATGKYESGSPRGVDYFGDSDYEPPCLVVDKYHYLYECRVSITGQPFLVHPTNIIQKNHG